MTATFILSLDCEGNWGVADHLASSTLSREALSRAYSDIVELLDTLEVRATFAFVGLFSLTPRQLGDFPLAALAERFAYVRTAYEALKVDSDGWIGDWAVERVRSASMQHELALHGVTHTPWQDMSLDDAGFEMSWISELPFRPSTFIYPRNQVRYPEILPAHGILGYRAARPRRSRLTSLLSELDLFPAPDEPVDGSPASIPAGYFVNWKRGLRNAIPVDVSVLRARRLLNRAVATGGIAHYWLHPENVASAPATLRVLAGILSEVARLRERGDLQVQTQHDYCRAQRRSPGPRGSPSAPSVLAASAADIG